MYVSLFKGANDLCSPIDQTNGWRLKESVISVRAVGLGIKRISNVRKKCGWILWFRYSKRERKMRPYSENQEIMEFSLYISFWRLYTYSKNVWCCHVVMLSLFTYVLFDRSSKVLMTPEFNLFSTQWMLVISFPCSASADALIQACSSYIIFSLFCRTKSWT